MIVVIAATGKYVLPTYYQSMYVGILGASSEGSHFFEIAKTKSISF